MSSTAGKIVQDKKKHSITEAFLMVGLVESVRFTPTVSSVSLNHETLGAL